MSDQNLQEFTDQEWAEAFLAETTLFLGPDPEIMNDHRMAPRTAEEDRLLSGPVDPNDLDRVRKRIVAGLDEAFEMMEQTGAAPGAKWGDLTSAVYSASGDLIHISTGGVLAFASVLHYPVRFINKYWANDPTVGVHDGDAFIHNDARYGNIHNTDQSMILPVFYQGELIAWVATIIHEGENGAKEPGGMPSSSESAYDDGIRMSPFKIVERGVIRRDLLTLLQNSVREPKLQYQDLKVKLYAAQRIKDRLVTLVDEVGRDAFITSLRKSLEDIEAEARRRIAALPDGTFRVNFFSDSTLRENVLLKYPCAITVKGDEMTIDWRGAAPQFANRAFNATLGTAKCGLGQALLGFFWPDLPRGRSGQKNPRSAWPRPHLAVPRVALNARLANCGAAPRQSMVSSSPFTVTAHGYFSRTFSRKVESEKKFTRNVPSGSSAIRRRASASMSSSDLRSEAMNASRPTSSTRETSRSLIRCAE